MHGLHLRPLGAADLDAARALLAAALPLDRAAVVAEEKLFGGNGPRAGHAVGAVRSDGRLVGVVATAGRWVKLLAVAPEARRQGIGTLLLEEARRRAPANARLRIFDHPGNYLSPGVDVRYAEARAFLTARGFVDEGTIENIRIPLDGNSLVTDDRAAELAERAAARGYRVGRASAAERAPLLAWIERAFAPIWAFEVARALDGPRAAVHVAWRGEEPVAFAAADGNNQGLGWFGPAGTDPAHRGRGLGEVLLLRCLLDVRGLPEGGVIAWIGPKAFYERSAGAVDDRRFTLFAEAAPTP
jgi:GNAT superfamily N-acetyltransferase